MEVPSKKPIKNKWTGLLLILLFIEIATYFITAEKLQFLRIVITMTWIAVALIIAALPFYYTYPDKISTLFISWLSIVVYSGVSYLLISMIENIETELVSSGIPIFILVATIVYLFFSIIFYLGRTE